MTASAKKITIVVPCYNEAAALTLTAATLGPFLQGLIEDGLASPGSHILFVDDGSTDETWETIKRERLKNQIFSGLKLSANRGHQAALLAGLDAGANSDYLVTIDADLQDDHEVIREMIELANSGKDVVYGVRRDREADSFFKRQTAGIFYSFMNFLGAKIIHHHADFRLISKRALNSLTEYKEVNIFLRGIFPLLGYPTAICYYKRKSRVAGESKYPFKRMLAFAIEGITSFSIKPLRLVTYLGIGSLLITLALSAWTLYVFLMGHSVAGWSSILISIYFLASVQLVCLGVIGEYIGKIYQEAKHRPRYHVEEKT